jgi:hypothetical protein
MNILPNCLKIIVIGCVFGLSMVQNVYAQVPPHVPGTICLTPTFWCWASEQGAIGDPCECMLTDGQSVSGIYG